MTLPHLLADLQRDVGFMTNVVAWETRPGHDGQLGEIPNHLHPLLRQSLTERGIHQLYTHQVQAITEAHAGRNLVVVTPTASGKTLCYNLPVLQNLLTDPTARALYLFPTKALAHDQLAELQRWTQTLTAHSALPAIPISAYDGDTPSAARSNIRRQSRLLISNPDMLHMGILPYHTNWADFFRGLRYVVMDELHVYRGVFGSHVANVLRRLKRIAQFHQQKGDPQPLQFICASATIANPQELAQRLVEEPVTLIDQNGAPRGEKHILLYNPPLYDAEHGLRRNSALETRDLAARCILAGVQTIVFARSRRTTEIILTYLRDRLARTPNPKSQIPDPRSIRGYRGGYLPTERREIEAGLRAGQVRGVVATNALELGIDIGQLQVSLLCGYPGSIAAAWQQMGRAGRTREAALAILVATADPLDQYILQHPEFLLQQSPERALIHPDNLLLLVDQLRCALFELPFGQNEAFGHCPVTGDVLALLAEEGSVQAHGERFFWSGEGYPARQVSLRSAGTDTVLIQSQEPEGARIIGEMDVETAQRYLHDGAVYLHEGESFLVTQLAFGDRVAHVQAVELDYYTVADVDVEIEVLHVHEERTAGMAHIGHGDLLVRSQVMGFRRIKQITHETLGSVPLDYPPQEVETTGYWLQVTAQAQEALEEAGLWRDSENNYGPNWQAQRALVRARDAHRCTVCGMPEPRSRQHHVHHLRPFRTFGYVAGQNEAYVEANQLTNLVLVCPSCHRRLEAGVRTHSGLNGLAYALSHLAPLPLMCDQSDLGVHEVRAGGASRPQPRPTTSALSGDVAFGPSPSVQESGPKESPERASTPAQPDPSDQLATLYLYERVAAGLGFSARLFEIHESLLQDTARLIANCACHHGCPACVGPILDEELSQMETRRLTLALIRALQGKYSQVTPTPPAPPPAHPLA